MKFTKYLTRFIFVVSMLSIAATRYSYMLQSAEFPLGAIVTVAGGSLKLRAEPSLDAKIVDAMPEGSILVVLDGPQYSGDIEWYKVDYGGKQGWASKKYMQITSLPEQQPAQDPAPESVPVDSLSEEVSTPVVGNESQPLLPSGLFSNFSNFSSSLICGGIVFFLVLYQAIRWFSRKDSPTIFVETVSIAMAVAFASYMVIRVIGGTLSVFMAVLIDYSVVGVITFIAYGFDKRMSSEAGAFRISEAGLHFMEALGGWVGAIIAQPTFNHKRKKFTYMFVFWIIVIAHIALLWGIFSR